MEASMEKRITEEIGGKPVGEVKKLNLDNCHSAQISGLTDDFKGLLSLSLANVGLTSLKGFPNLPNLRKLDLSNNEVSGGLDLLHGCPRLFSLNLSGNKVVDIETLEPLKELKDLKTLDLYNCEVTNIDDYQRKVFQLLNGLEALDGFDRDNKEAEDDESSDEGEDGDGVVDFDEDDGGEGDDDEGDDDEEDSGGEGDEDGDEEEDQAEGQSQSRGVKRKHADEEADH